MSWSLICALLLVTTVAGQSAPGAGAVGRTREGSLLQTWNNALGGASEKETPVTRVVNLLKEMGKTLEKEMTEDEELYRKMACWCNANEYEKDNAISGSTSKISELESSIEGLAAKGSELKLSIKELEGDVANDKQALGEATALREKQLNSFHGEETDAVQAIEQLKAAIEVLSKHHAAPPDSTVDGGAIFKSEKDSWSFIATRKRGFPWSEDHEESEVRSLDDFMRNNGFSSESDAGHEAPAAGARTAQKFLQQQGKSRALSAGAATEVAAGETEEWTSVDTAVVNRALKTASAFMQAHHSETYMPAYTAQSGEIMGVLQQLKDEMQDSLAASQKSEQARGAAFAELRSAKVAQIENGERMAEGKEDELADNVNALAEAKEDLGQEQAKLSEDQKFLNNLKETCGESDKNFEERKNARMAEMQAVADTIHILQQDEARDAISGTYSSFFQVSSDKADSDKKARHQAAEALRAAAKKAHSPQLSIMATSVELDAFSKVKKAIDDMIAMLKQQQDDEVKKSDWCKAELQSNEMATAKTTDHKADLESKMSELESNIKALEDGLAEAKSQISQQELDLQRASENRKAENADFQKTVADQLATVDVLKKALDKLATYYDLLQTKQKNSSKQAPPMPQKEYAPSKSAPGVMEMIEKLLHEAQALMGDSRKSESEAQAAYEQSIADTNASIQALAKDIVAKTKAKGKATKAMLQTKADHADTEKELEGLSKYDADLHAECDYLLKNFEVRQTGRSQEIEALQQAKQILSGASLS